ncbi:hypothetical protein Hanom_Chr17g01591041 [Helianthus anomalus]
MSQMPIRDSSSNDEAPGQSGNRHSIAARKIRALRIRALERRIKELRDNANACLSYLALLRSDNSETAARNRELRSRLQAMEPPPTAGNEDPTSGSADMKP